MNDYSKLEIMAEQELLNISKSYYDRNASKYEAATWYFGNKYKENTVNSELGICANLLKDHSRIKVLEIGPGTGYLAGRLTSHFKMNIEYTAFEHSKEMNNILGSRTKGMFKSFSVIEESISTKGIKTYLSKELFDLIIGSSILHHLPFYAQVIHLLAERLSPNGLMYFVREPIHRNECERTNMVYRGFDAIYSFIGNILMKPSIRNIVWPHKIKAEQCNLIGVHMYRNGISLKPFFELTNNNFEVVFLRKYNRRLSGFLSYLENSWLSFTRRDKYGNTLFAICIQNLSKTT